VSARLWGLAAALTVAATGLLGVPTKAGAAARAVEIMLDEAIAGDHRSAANRERDAWRHPKETLLFFGLEPGMTVMEVWPGGGWYTEILAPVLQEGGGRLLAASWDPASDSDFVKKALAGFRTKLDARPDLYGRVEVTALQYPTAMEPTVPGTVDLVLTFRNLHNWMPRDATRPMLEAMFKALKPGGLLGVVEHRASTDQPQDLQAKSGYVREDYAVELIESVGFRLEATSEINANPADTRDYEGGVWTLPPTLRQGERDRERFLAIGESDRFTLRFRKPAE